MSDIPQSPPNGAGPFAFGSDVFPGGGKLLEEMGELQQVLGKLIATGGRTDHWDGTDLGVRLEEELADVMAALSFFIGINGLDMGAIDLRADQKLTLFEQWHQEGLSGEER